jgi:pimeloyl-ACP methyl ester carboxylesterase
MTYRLVRFPSGRDVGMTGIGDPAARHLAIFFHPTPGASGFDPDPTVTARSGLHILTFDRPGYGATEPDNLQVSEWVDDLAGYLRSAESTAITSTGTKYGPIAVIGWREGGIYAAAFATRHPHLVSRLALVGAPAPKRASIDTDPEVINRRKQLAKLMEKNSRPGYQDRLDHMREAAYVHGGIGATADRNAFKDVPPPSSNAPALILYSAGDSYATIQDANWYAAGMPNAQVERVEAAVGPIADRWEEVLRFVREPN